MPRLVLTDGPNAGKAYPLEESLTIGRGADNDVVLPASEVSRRHARIAWENGAYVIADLGSKNGTMVNGEPITGPRTLRGGDAIGLPGFSFMLEAAEDETAQTVQVVSLKPPVLLRPASSPISLKQETAEVVVRGKTIQLPPKEYLALVVLYERAGQLVSKEELASRVWPEYGGDVSDYNIHQVISRLRRALEEDPAKPRLLITRAGFGYRLAF
jgi:pSer/pThr/pTyr-binding forkhead associated (FHA) protein